MAQMVPITGPGRPDPIALLMQMLSGQQAQPVNPSLLAQPIQTPGYVPPQEVPSSAGPAGDQSPLTANNPFAGFQKMFENYGRTWQDPEFARNFPFPRGDQNSPAANIAAGAGNSLINLPQNIWNAGYSLTGHPTNEVVGANAKNAWDFFATPEGAAKAGDAGGEAPPPAFTPAIPDVTNKITGVESGGKQFAKNPNSSAFGPGQFIKSTWMEFMKEAYPEIVKNRDANEVLKLRSDPNLADQATSWYAGKAVDELDKLNMPATDANIYLHHFLGPDGMKKILTADPNALASSVLSPEQVAANKTILGGATTVQDVIDWSAAKMGEGVGLRPTPAPHQAAPDFSAAQGWLEQAAPQGIDPQMLKDLQFAEMLKGIGAGLGGVNAEQEGGGALFGSLAAGTTQGVANAKTLAAQFDMQLKGEKSAYAKGMAEFESGKAETQTSVDNANTQTDWMNENADRTYTNQQNEFERTKAANEKLLATPKIIESSDKGLWIQDANGVQFLPSGNDQWTEMEKIGKALGMDNTLFRQQKYTQMAQSSNILSIEMEIAKDVLADGLGPAIWGDGYSEALDAATKQIGDSMAADPKAGQEAIQKALAGLLLGASQQSNNYDWIIQAAAMGNPGAMMLAQGGQQKGQPQQ